MPTRNLTITPFVLPGGSVPEVRVTIALVDSDRARIQGISVPDGDTIIDSVTVDVIADPVVVPLWPQPEIEPVLNDSSCAEPGVSLYLVTLEHKPTRYKHRFAAQVESGSAELSWPEFVAGAVDELPSAWFAHITDDAVHVPPGGNAGEVLSKASDADGATVWGSAGGGGHVIYVDGVVMPQQPGLDFLGATGTDTPGVTTIEGLKGDPGSGVVFRGSDTWANIDAIVTPLQNDAWALTEATGAPVRPDASVAQVGDWVVWDSSAWTNIGPHQGEPGADGAEGPTGPEGPEGPAGPQGDPGLQGADGVSGADGAPGADGFSPVIDTGGTGNWVDSAGDTGVAAQGPQGDPGPAGADGADGAPGAGTQFKGTDTWANVDSLSDQVQGDTWVLTEATGAPNDLEGNPAEVGDRVTWNGSSWDNVGAGAVGPPGADGADGAPGADGADGAPGTEGPAGPSTPSADADNALVVGTDSLLLAPLAGSGSASTIARSDHNHAGAYDPAGSAASVQSNLDSHAGSGANPHNVTKDQVGLGNAENTTDIGKPISSLTQTALDGKKDDFSENSAFNKNFGNQADQVCQGNDARLSDARDPLAHAHTLSNITDAGTAAASDVGDFATAAQGVLAGSALQAVANDPNPTLGGNLKVGGSQVTAIELKDTADSTLGFIGVSDQDDEIVVAKTSPDGLYDPSDGGILIEAGGTQLYGSNVGVKTLAHTDPTGYHEVHATTDGNLYGVSPPAPSWTVADTSTDDNDLVTNDVWVELTELNIVVPQDIAIDDLIEATIKVYFINGNKEAVVAIGIGVNSLEPITESASASVIQSYSGRIIFGIKVVMTEAIASGDRLRVWAKRTTGTVTLTSSGSTQANELIVNAPSPSSGVGGGDPTNITIDQSGASNIVVQSSTGINGTILPATSTEAGGMSAADKATLDGLGSPLPARVAVALSGTDTWAPDLVDGDAYLLNIATGATISLAPVSSGDDAANEYTCSFEINFTGTGTINIDAGIRQMSTFGAITDGDGETTCILRSRADGTIELYRSVEVTS